MAMINKESPIPLYFQLQEILHDKLENGVWKPGDRLPPEEELCAQYGKNARRLAEKQFSRDRLANRLEQILSRVTKDKPERPNRD